MADTRDKSRPPQWPLQEPKKPAAEPAAKPMQDRGRIMHDERGNAVWNWVKETGRFCIDSTSAMLKKLDFGDLKIEGQKDEDGRPGEPKRDAGGGYDPYNQPTAPRKPKPTSKK